MRLTIDLDDEETAILKKRAKKNMFELKEQVEDIVRRSCINAKNAKVSQSKCDDKLVDIFSRDARGKKTNQKKKI
ncbi:MAG: hypothetical protein WC979_08435 [Candidatus Pacearchaeota archaeon]|jgi:hypothetical protein